MSFIEPSITDFKNYFTRDFPYGTDASANIIDQDISNAITDAHITINQDLFSTQDEFTVAFLNLAAHCMVMNLRASSQGINGQYAWLESSKGVGSVSESFAIPARISENPQLAMFAKTNYGAKYLMLMIPYLTGAMFSVMGGTHS